MKIRPLIGILAVVFTLGLMSGFAAAASDPITEAEKREQAKPGLMETRAIAEEGFVDGLPIVMDY